MINRRDRVIATLIVWIVMLMTLGLSIQQFSAPNVNIWGNWYSFQMITSADPAQASQMIDALNAFTTNNYQMVQAFIAEQIRAYAPLTALLALALIGATVFATYVIWRSVIVPDVAHQTAEKRKLAARSERAYQDQPLAQAEHEAAAHADESQMAQSRKARS